MNGNSTQTCRYDDCPNAASNAVCRHEDDDGCDCRITCPLCRAYLGLDALGVIPEE